MSNLYDILRRHWDTFYDYDTGEPRPIWKRTLLLAVASLLIVLLFEGVGSEVISALLTVQSILIGFSFSVLFFLLSGAAPGGDSGGSIEKSLTSKRLKKLSNELFYNVSYFNIVATMSIVVALLLLLPGFDKSTIMEALASIDGGVDFATQNKKGVTRVLFWLSEIFNFLLVFLFCESTATFIRTVSRVSFFFEKRLKQQNESS